MSIQKEYLEQLESEIPSIQYIQSQLEQNGTHATEDEIRGAIGFVIIDSCKDKNNNYTGSKRLLITRFGSDSDLQKIKKYIDIFKQ
jgi:hypothetical protein